MKKIIEIILNILTLGFFAWGKFKKNEKKLVGVYKSVNMLLKDPEASNIEKAKSVLRTYQMNEGIFKDVSNDLVELYEKGILTKAKN